MSNLNVSVSYYKNYRESQSTTQVDLYEWLTTDQYKQEILQLRSCGKEQRNQIKATLPAITDSGVFMPNREARNLVLHSGFICIDIDGDDNKHITRMEQVKEGLTTIPEIAFCGLSASGKGLYLIIPIEVGSLHKEYFKAISHYFLKEWDIVVDKACSDVCRLRGVSYDSNYYINLDAISFKALPKSEQVRPKKTLHSKSDNDMVDTIVTAVLSQKIDITAKREDWFQICSVLVNLSGEKGRGLFHELSQFHPSYNIEECNKLYDDLMDREPYGYGIGTLVFIFKQYSNL